jgi:hypothetical protein
MYTDRSSLKEYPFTAIFSRIAVDESLPLDQQTCKQIVVMTTPCDIAESSATLEGNLTKSRYAIYLPISPATEKIPVRRGDRCEAEIYGVTVDGTVTGVFPSQLKGCTIYVNVTDV